LKFCGSLQAGMLGSGAGLSYVQLDIEPSFKHQRVVDCILQILFRPQVPFRRQDRLMPQQKLNLLQLAALRAAEFRRR
jgi:hypothetical protein